MEKSSSPVFTTERYIPNIRERFLWWLSTAEEQLLSDCVVDRNRHSIIGMLVLGTWLFATLVWTYFFITVVTAWWAALLLGIFMGGIILFIDRALIKGMKVKLGGGWWTILFRGLLALTIGLFMAQPALLFLFDAEIKVQVSIDNEQRKRKKLVDQQAVYKEEKNGMMLRKQTAKKELNELYTAVAAARKDFMQEMDGTGGSKKVGLKNIAMAKQAAYQKLDTDYQERLLELKPIIVDVDSSLKDIETRVQQEQQAFERLLNNGFITRIEALNHLVSNNNAVSFRYYLLVALLMLIELMPVLSKLLLPAGTYSLQAELQEEMERKRAYAIKRI
ncbi:MAG: DUF4407 domain-containing protein [Sphingobacteriia bacterium]|nr:MAG: DUF4407 domain-containing protein [Sphingobacteriia bacterium]